MVTRALVGVRACAPLGLMSTEGGQSDRGNGQPQH